MITIPEMDALSTSHLYLKSLGWGFGGRVLGSLRFDSNNDDALDFPEFLRVMLWPRMSQKGLRQLLRVEALDRAAKQA